METNCGLRGQITPVELFNNYEESFQDGPFTISIENNIIEIGYENESLSDEARIKVGYYIDAKSFELGKHLSVDIDSSWKKNSNGGKTTKLSLSETVYSVELQGITTTHIVKGKASIVKQIDNRSLAQQKEIVKKIDNNPVLGSVLKYFNEEVIDSNKPLYGIYKAIEALVKELGKNGKEKLGKLIGENKEYVNDITRTAQLTRHHKTDAREILTDSECRERAKILIKAYMDSIGGK